MPLCFTLGFVKYAVAADINGENNLAKLHFLSHPFNLGTLLFERHSLDWSLAEIEPLNFLIINAGHDACGWNIKQQIYIRKQNSIFKSSIKWSWMLHVNELTL